MNIYKFQHTLSFNIFPKHLCNDSTIRKTVSLFNSSIRITAKNNSLSSIKLYNKLAFDMYDKIPSLLFGHLTDYYKEGLKEE